MAYLGAYPSAPRPHARPLAKACRLFSLVLACSRLLMGAD